MTLSINSYNLMNPISRTTSSSFQSSNSLGANPNLFSEFVSKSKPYEQYLKTAATLIVDFLKSVQDMQASAQKLMQKDQSSFQARTAESSDSKKVTYSVNGGAAQTSQSNTIDLEKGKATATLVAQSIEAVKIQIKPDEDKVIAHVKALVSNYNTMHDRLKEAGGVMNASVRKSLESLVSSSGYERIGIQRNGDGTLKLDEEQLKKSLSSNFEQTTKAISGKYGLADRLSSAAERYNEVPASNLLNSKARQVQHFSMYQSSMQMAMLTQASGWVVNSHY